MRATKPTALLIFAMLAACGGSSATTGPAGTTRTTAGNSPTAAPQATPGGPAGGTGAVVHVEVASGPQAGTYDKSGPKLDCNLGSTGSGATFLDTAETKGLTGVTFTSGSGTPRRRSTSRSRSPIRMSLLLQQPALEVSTLDPSKPKGSGTAHLQDNQSTITWSFDGKTADAIGVKTTITCGPVDRT